MTDPADANLGSASFSAEPTLAAPLTAAHRFSRHGAVRVAAGGRYLEHADGTPFFFLADTAWNGPLLSTEADWAVYLRDRVGKGFTAVQFIAAAPWAGAYTNAEGEVAYTTQWPASLNAGFFDRIDARIDAINAAGLLAVPVLLWAAKFGDSARYNPGQSLPEMAAVALARYQVERYRDRQVMWVLAGDGKYAWPRCEKWKRIGRAVFGDLPRRAPVAMHPMGGHWPYRSFGMETWLDVAGYQTSHSDDVKTMRYLHEGLPASDWARRPARPVINLEPCYEAIRNFNTNPPVPFDASGVRRAVYASLLNAPTAGVAYGAHGIWSWELTAREPLNHAGTGVALPWHEAMHLPGSEDMRRVAELFTSIEWWTLRPAPQMLAVQPGAKHPQRFISASKTEDGRAAIVYLPYGDSVLLNIDQLPTAGIAEWFNPRTGERTPAGLLVYDTPRHASSGRGASAVSAPDTQDWVLVISPASV